MAVIDVGNTGLALPGLAIVISAGSFVSIVLVITACICCRKPKSTHHRASVKKNVVAEEDMHPLGNRTPINRRGKGRPPSMIFDGTPMGCGRWDDLTNICENDVPVKYRQENAKPERPSNPPDIIPHPALRHVLRSESRPQSTIILRTPLSPSPLRVPPPSTSLEELIAQHTEDTPETLLSRFSINRGEGRKEQSKDGSILYYRPKETSVEANRIGNLAQTQHVSRDRIRSSEEPPVIPANVTKKRGVTPSDPGDLRGLPRYDRLSGEWDNVPKPGEGDVTPPPPLPSRKYLDDEVEVNAGVSMSDWSEDMPRPQNRNVTVEQATRVKEVHKRRSRDDYENTRPRSLGSHPKQPSPKRKSRDQSHVTESSEVERQHRSHPSHAQHEESEADDNVAYSKDERDLRIAPLHQDAQRHRQQNGDVRGRPALVDRHVVLEDHQRRHQNRRMNDLIQENVPQSSYEPNRVNFMPGVYLRPKPYYPYTGLQDHSKRFSDASDYSDFLYERSPHYADRVNRDFDPYFFQSRWSTAVEAPPQDRHRRRRNSDFVLDDNYGIQRDQQPIRQQYRRPLIVEETCDSDVIKDHAGRVSRSSGYQSQSSRNEESSSELNLRIRGRLLPPPPQSSVPPLRVRTGKFYPRPTQPPTHPSIQHSPLPDVPFRYHHSPERNRREEGSFRQEMRLGRYLPPAPPRDVAPDGYRPSHGVLIEENYHSTPTTPLRDVRYRPTTKSRGGSNERQNPPPQDVSPERYRSPRRSQKRRRGQQPDLIEGHPKPAHAPQAVTKEQQPNINEHDHYLRSHPRDVTADLSHSAQALSNDVTHDHNSRSQPRDVTAELRQSALALSNDVIPSSSQSSLSKRPSTEYGSLIDIMYSYRQTVRESRQKENPAESPESRLRYERNKLKTKLQKELEPRHRQSRNLDMVIDTLLYLCERDNNNTVKRRSWQRDNPDRPKSKSRPNSAIVAANDDQILQIYSRTSDVTIESSDYAFIQGESTNLHERTRDQTQHPNITVENANPKASEMCGHDPKLSEPPPEPKARRRHDYSEITLPPSETQPNEFAFPSEETLAEILKQNAPNPPPIPPRRNRGPKVAPPNENSPPVASPSKNVNSESPKIPPRVISMRNTDSASHEQDLTSPKLPPRVTSARKTDSKLQEEDLASPTVPPRVTSIKKSDSTSHEREQQQEPPYAKIKKRRKPHRRCSLPSMHLTESEINWLQESGGKLEDVTKRKYSKFEKGAKKDQRKFKSTRVAKGSSQYAFTPEARVSPVEKPTENVIKEKEEYIENTFTFDDISLGEDADAEDVITAIQQHMSESKSPEISPLKPSKKSIPYYAKARILSDSDMGTWSSVASSELPPAPPRRARFNRSEGKYPRSTENTPLSSPTCTNQKNRFHTPPRDGNRGKNTPSSPAPTLTGDTPSGSPIFMQPMKRFHTPPPGGNSSKHTQPISIPRKESLSPVSKYPVFETPPGSSRGPSPLVTAQRSCSVANIPTTATSSPSVSPRIFPQPSGSRFTPRKQQDLSKQRMSRITHSSAPGTPISGPKTPLKRVPSKFAPKIPFVGKKFVQPTVPTEILPKEPDKRRISRKGEIVTIPDDNDYADPFDCLRNNSPSSSSPYRDFLNTPSRRASSYTPLSPRIVLPHSQDGTFYPIREDGFDGDDEDYAFPFNCPPNLLLRHRILSRSTENILNDFETAV